MASETISTPGIPEGTTVGAYPASRWREDQLPPSGAPLGAAINTQVVASQRVTFTGLTAGVDYFATDATGSRYYRFTVDADQTGSVITPSDGSVTTAKLADGAVTTGKIANDAVTAAKIDPDVFSVYRKVLLTAGRFSAAGVAATKYMLIPGISDQSAPAPNIGSMGANWLLALLAADWAIVGRTTKLRVNARITTVGAPAVNVVFNLYPVVAGATVTLGAAVAGSTVTINAPAANSIVGGNSGDFDLPADGNYAIGYTVSGTPANAAAMLAELELRHV